VENEMPLASGFDLPSTSQFRTVSLQAQRALQVAAKRSCIICLVALQAPPMERGFSGDSLSCNLSLSRSIAIA
jgi:hypothetical protein